MAEAPEPTESKSTAPDLNSSTDNSSLPEPTPTNPDPEQARQAAIQSHNQKFQNTTWTAPQQVNGGHILGDAVAQIGQPHQWGGNTPGGFDSQGLAKYAYQQNGIPMSHLIHNQMQHGTTIDPGQLQPGDLVFVATGDPQVPDRTGVYAGSGVIVHSSPGAGVVASRISHVGKIVGTTHLDSVVRSPTKKAQPIPPDMYATDDVMPHNRLSAALKPAVANVARIHV
jgi:cell wall-associated NlpC family hydrolase